MNQKYLQGLSSNMESPNEAVFFEATPENITAFLMQHQWAQMSAIGTVDDRSFLTARMGLIDTCPDQAYLLQKLLPIYAKVQMGDIPVPKLKTVPKEIALAEKCPKPDWNYLRWEGYSDKKYQDILSGKALLDINTANMSNEMFLSMMSAFAQEESISISKNMRKGAVMRMKNGTFRLSQAPYGYYLDEKGILIVQQEESKIVQRIFGNFLSGMGIQEIAAELQKEHIPKLNGEPIWSYTGILYILTNERYIGDELFQKRYTTDTLPFQKKINRGQKKQYYAEDTHDPIISREVFRKAQELLKRKSERHGHQNNGQYTFTSLIVCDECGTNFCRRIAKNQRVLWTCRKHFKGKHLCSMESLNETEIQQCFLTLYKKLAENRQEILGSYLRQLEELKDKDFMAHPDAMELNRQIAGLLEQNHTLHRLRAKECIDSAFFIAQSNELSQKISNLKAELKQYRDLNEYADFIDNTRLILTILDSPMPVFSSSVFRNIVSRITVTHETLRFQLVNGLELEEERISGG